MSSMQAAASVASAPLKLELRGLGKRYGKVVSLVGADLAMRDGEFLTLLGPSGSGKTTMLSLIAGLIEPSEGQIWIDGRDATRLPSQKRDLGLVFQNYALFPHLSIFENVAFPLRMRRHSQAEIRKQVGEVLEIVRLSHAAERLPAELSGGQQQRVALARCFVYQPSIILMDEPLGALDKRLRDHMQIEIRRLSRERGASVVYVTHDQEEALVMSDRICLVNEGRIEQIGTPHQLYYEPATLFAAGFIGESNMIAVSAGAGDAPRVLPDGMALRCRGTIPAAGTPARLVVRPESLRVLAPGEEADNVLTAVVELVTMTGAMTRVHARMPGGEALVAALPSRFAGIRVVAGDSVRLGFDQDAAIVLPYTGAPGASVDTHP
jgi:putative spermidine/putrescine transport system ATP-binding protein